jgi:hypothetical protein
MRTLVRSALVLGTFLSAPVIASAEPEKKDPAADTKKDTAAPAKDKAKAAAPAKDKDKDKAAAPAKDKADAAKDKEKDKGGW